MNRQSYIDIFNDYIRHREQNPISYKKHFSKTSYAFSNNVFTFIYVEMKRQKDLLRQLDFVEPKRKLKKTKSLFILDHI